MGIKDMNRKGILINVAVFVGFLILCMGGGGLMGAITRNDFGDSSEWYTKLIKPSFNPPSYLFGIVWPILYLLMAISAFAVWTKTGITKEPAPLVIFFIQLALNFLWTLIFGKAKDLLAAFVEILVLIVFIVLTMVFFARVKGRAWTPLLLLPYLAWVCFATALNWNLYALNKEGDE
ncbi:tryptophan-rich protein TspO-like isoform X2 [Bolinopsis microptera]|uniref:tryptophan-rich protein TspO-like isoform X2 n=1 Tax=Bolinopsis microptera TaxID=2820187 RepID=UPI003079CC45